MGKQVKIRIQSIDWDTMTATGEPLDTEHITQEPLFESVEISGAETQKPLTDPMIYTLEKYGFDHRDFTFEQARIKIGEIKQDQRKGIPQLNPVKKPLANPFHKIPEAPPMPEYTNPDPLPWEEKRKRGRPRKNSLSVFH